MGRFRPFGKLITLERAQEVVLAAAHPMEAIEHVELALGAGLLVYFEPFVHTYQPETSREHVPAYDADFHYTTSSSSIFSRDSFNSLPRTIVRRLRTSFSLRNK